MLSRNLLLNSFNFSSPTSSSSIYVLIPKRLASVWFPPAAVVVMMLLLQGPILGLHAFRFSAYKSLCLESLCEGQSLDVLVLVLALACVVDGDA